MIQKIRLSPSGPVIGTPPQLVGGGSVAPGRVWVGQGTGATQQLPGTAAGAVTGLDAVVVDILPSTTGYKYDLEFDTMVKGDLGTNGGYNMILVGSLDGGATFTVAMGNLGGLDILRTGEGRLHITNFVNPAPTPINRVQARLIGTYNANPALLDAPAESAVRITEYSSGVIL